MTGAEISALAEDVAIAAVGVFMACALVGALVWIVTHKWERG